MKKTSATWNTRQNERQILDRFSRMVRVKREQRRLAQKNSANRSEATKTLLRILNNGSA